VFVLLLGVCVCVVCAQQFCGLAPIFRPPHKSMQQILVFSHGIVGFCGGESETGAKTNLAN